MSKSTLSTLKGEINMEKKAVGATESTLTDLEKCIFSYVSDEVGHNASESVKSIRNGFSRNMDEGYRSIERAVNALERGYNEISSASNEAQSLAARARAIKRELGNL